MAVVTLTTDVTRTSLPTSSCVTNASLRVNSRSSFTLHYAIWPFVGLISLIATVWILVYILAMFARRHKPKTEQQNSASIYITQDSTIAGGYEASIVVSPADA